MNTLQARLIASGLDLEARSMARGSKIQMTREPAMKSLGRLLGVDAYAIFGKGIKGRDRAFDWINEQLTGYGLEPVDRMPRD